MNFDELSRDVLADVSKCLAAVDAAQVSALVGQLASRRQVFLLGSGRTGAVLNAMAIRLGHLGIEAHTLGAAGCPALRTGGLVLAASGSGRTSVPLRHAAAARSSGASVTLITADPCSAMAKLADSVIHIPAHVTLPEHSPHTLRSLFEECLLVTCDCICRMLQDKLGITTADMQSRHSGRE